MGTAIKHPLPDRVKLLFVIFDIRALWRSALYPCGNSGRQMVNTSCFTFVLPISTWTSSLA